MSKAGLLALIDSDAEKDLQIHFLQSFLRAASPNPPGDTVAAARVVTNFLAHQDIESSIISPKVDAPNVVSHFVCTSSNIENEHALPKLIMNGHLDVFPVSDGDQWTHDPWAGEIDTSTNKIYGRGVVDMKAGTAALAAAYAYLFRFKNQLHGTCLLQTVSDEETGGKWGTAYLLNEDEDSELWREGAVLNAEPSGFQSYRFGEKGTLRMTFTVQTPGGHGAFLHLDEGAIRISTRLITSLISLIENSTDFHTPPDIEKHLRRPDVMATIDTIMGTGAAAIMSKPTVNIGTISGGSKVNVIPNECVFEVDIRLPIGLTASTILIQIDKLLSTDFPQAKYSVHEAASNPANACAPEHPLAIAIADNAEAVLGEGNRPLGIPSMGATDVKHFRYLGVPGYSFGVSPEGMARRDECIDLRDYLALIKVLAGTGWDYLGGGK
ncbi:hypothetical protein AAFC00_004265 [Neodothiora populina]|uniref:Peptidase M20 dimerisation domain-containing protein n=1 Tax=Neodothiora populina TaxID=2781224 RepID=A0ABR3PJF1_9PEZI